MTGPFDDGARTLPTGPVVAPVSMLYLELIRTVKICGARWQRCDQMFLCRCYRDRRYPHVCTCVCELSLPEPGSVGSLDLSSNGP